MRKLLSALTLSAFALSASAWADVLEIQENAPDKYVVVKGDTLWDISGKFLKKPWRWPEIWQLNNESIKHPHWIYPGDTIVLDRSGDQPRLSLVKGEGHGLTAHQPGPGVGRLEVRERRGHRGEGVGLVLEAADRDTRHGTRGRSPAMRATLAEFPRALRAAARLRTGQAGGALPP